MDSIYEKNKRQWEEGAKQMEATGWGLLRLLFGVSGWCYAYVRPVFLIYVAPLLLVGLTWLSATLGLEWYQSLPRGTIALTPFTEGQVLKAIGHSLGLIVMFLVTIAGGGGVVGALVSGFLRATWVTRVVSAYYVWSLARALYHELAGVRSEQPFWTGFLVCFAVSVAAEGARKLWRWRMEQRME